VESKDTKNASAFVSSAGSEFLLWEVPESLMNGKTKEVQEILQPSKIMDIESS